jgi:hypothetical protein
VQFLGGHGIDGSLDLVAAERPHQKNVNQQSTHVYEQTLCARFYAKLAFATTAASGRFGEQQT